MNFAHLHLLLNHIPVLLPLFVLPVLLYGILKKNSSLVRLSLLGFVISGLMVWPVYATGEEAEEVVENMAGVEHDYIEEHEEAAEWTKLSLSILGVLSLGALVWSRKKPDLPALALYVLLILGVVAVLAAARC